VVGRYQNDAREIQVKRIERVQNGPVRQSVKVSGVYKSSKIEYTYTLDAGADFVAVDAVIDWLEAGDDTRGIPQIHYIIDCGETSEQFLYDIPFGAIRRDGMDMDAPALSYACSQPESGTAAAIISKTKYGYRCVDDAISLTLVRSSFSPDPYPELCRHTIQFAVAVCREPSPAAMYNLSAKFVHRPFSHSVTPHEGRLPAETSLIGVCDGQAAIESVKLAEDGSGDLIVRLSDVGDGGDVSLAFAAPVKSAAYCDIMESKGEACVCEGNKATLTLRKLGVTTVRVSAAV
jgi:alpha-mannosidase